MSYNCAVVGAGSQGWVHACGYQATTDARLVAVASRTAKSATKLARDLGIRGAFDSYEELLRVERPDVISICTPPSTHLEVAKAAIAAGVKAIHCEKPMATSYNEVLELHGRAQAADVQLTVNLQRRFEAVHQYARRQLVHGAIGEIISLEGYCPNLPDWGTHVIDLLLFYLGDRAPSWVTGQVDVSINRYVYDVFAETSSITQVNWDNGINAIITTGREPQTPVLNLENNLGIIVQGSEGRLISCGDSCLVRRFGYQDSILETPNNRDSNTWERGVDPSIIACTEQAIADLLASLTERDRSPVLRSEIGLRSAEIIYATYESSRSRSRIILPLQNGENALIAGLSQGFWQPVGELHSTY